MKYRRLKDVYYDSMNQHPVILDIETTGLSYQQGHKIVEIAILNTYTRQYYHTLVNPLRKVPSESTKIHGLTIKDVADAPIFPMIKQKVIDFIGLGVIIAHNASFDIGFIQNEAQEVITNEIIDTIKLAKDRKIKTQSYSLDSLCKVYNISLESRKNNHDALNDVFLLEKVYNILRIKQQYLGDIN